MEGADSDPQKELVALEAEEALVSAERRRLHQQIDFGYASETTRAREQEVSNTGVSCIAESTCYENS